MTHFRPKKSSFVSGNRSGEKFLSPPARIVECVSEYVFLISKKQTNKQKKQQQQECKKVKETKEEKRISKSKINLRPG